MLVKSHGVCSKPQIVRQRYEGLWIERVKGRDAENIFDALFPDPDELFAKGAGIQSPWQSETTDKVIVNLSGKSYFLKRYKCLGFKYRIKNIFRKSRAKKSWDAAWSFYQQGIPTPLPLICVEERKWRLLGGAFLATAFLPESKSLLDCWPENTEIQRRILQTAAKIIAKMHSGGILHGDLNWRNLLVQEKGGGYHIFLVDLDGCRFSRSFNPDSAEKDLAHFLRDLHRASGDRQIQEYFLSQWKQSLSPASS